MDQASPMIKQYQKIKANHKDNILFFRLGDFYEMFFDDAKKASSILDLVLTSRGKDKSVKIPMCGIPYHAADSYISRLIKAGQKVAICEQVEDPSLSQGIVKRAVVRVITSGTFIDENSYDSRYVFCLNINKNHLGISFTDTSSGTIYTNEYSNIQKAIDTISKHSIYECIFPSNDESRIKDILKKPLLNGKKITLSPYDDWVFNTDMAKKSLCDHLHTKNLKGFGIENMPLSISCTGALLEYLKQMNQQPLLHINKISLYSDSEYVLISSAACYGLELDYLRQTLDKTMTPLGKRMFRYWLYHPLKDCSMINERQNAVNSLKHKPDIHENLKHLLKNIPDIEKNLSRISCGYTHAKDLLALRNTTILIPELQKVLLPLAEENPGFSLNDIPDIRELLTKAICPDIPLSKPEGKIIQNGYNEELDELRDIQENGREWLRNLQKQEIKRSGINSLKIGFNKIFGYYIEITKTNLHLVPEDYIRKQTLVNAERFIIHQLKEFEEKMITSQEKIIKIESSILNILQTKILEASDRLHLLSSQIAAIDCLYSLTTLAFSPGYILPEVNDSSEIIIKSGRHPVVEQTFNEPFIPNDTLIDCRDNHLLIITGPNMAGKSTYIRQVAILVIMAQLGSFIPAEKAGIGIVDKIFTRIGAHDAISKGQSTFMVEMSETAEILNNLSNRSLLILDEIGRGTSTYDGLSLAWSIAEHLQKNKVRTLFATHFHELTSLAENLSGVKNYNVAVKEWGDEIVFLHKIVTGGTDDSYGIYVAELAGIPKEVVNRSRQILNNLETQKNIKNKITNNKNDKIQLGLFTEEADNKIKEIKKDLTSLNINNLTPLEALNKIYLWKQKLNKK